MPCPVLVMKAANSLAMFLQRNGRSCELVMLIVSFFVSLSMLFWSADDTTILPVFLFDIFPNGADGGRAAYIIIAIGCSIFFYLDYPPTTMEGFGLHLMRVMRSLFAFASLAFFGFGLFLGGALYGAGMHVALAIVEFIVILRLSWDMADAVFDQ